MPRRKKTEEPIIQNEIIDEKRKTEEPIVQNEVVDKKKKTISKTVSALALNVRVDKNLSAEIINILHKGDKVDIISKFDGWYKVRFRNGMGTGFVKSEFIK